MTNFFIIAAYVAGSVVTAVLIVWPRLHSKQDGDVEPTGEYYDMWANRDHPDDKIGSL